MTDFDYERWWELHLRNAKNEVLSAQEQVEYAAGLAFLDSQDTFVDSDLLDRLHLLRISIRRASAVRAELLARTEELDREISALGCEYHKLTGQNLEPLYVAAY